MKSPRLLPLPAVVAYSDTVRSECFHNIASLEGLSTRVFVDLGAHMGLFSLWALAITEDSQSYAYEPYPDNFNILRQHVSLNNWEHNLFTYEEALWESNGEEDLSVSSDPYSESHMISSIESLPFSGETVRVRTVSPQVVFDRLPADLPIGYLKSNCQGGEFFLLSYLLEHEEILQRTERMFIDSHPSCWSGEGLAQYVTMFIDFRTRYVDSGLIAVCAKVASLFAQGVSPEVLEVLTVNTL